MFSAATLPIRNAYAARRSGAVQQWTFRQWVAAITVIALLAWLFEFATHLHVPAHEKSAEAATSHLCGFCASFQGGAGPTANTLHITPASAATVTTVVSDSIHLAPVRLAYRSRAPPLV